VELQFQLLNSEHCKSFQPAYTCHSLHYILPTMASTGYLTAVSRWPDIWLFSTSGSGSGSAKSCKLTDI